MSAPVTEAHRKLLRTIYDSSLSIEDDAQLIADSEARAIADLQDQLKAEMWRADAGWAERDDLRAEVERLKNLLLQADELNEGALFKISETMKRAERAEAELKRYTDAVDAQPWATDEPIRVLLDRVTMLWASEKQAKVERGDMLCECQAELAKERARLDWMQAQEVKRGFECGITADDPSFLVLGDDGTTHWGNTYRDAIDAAMKEDAK